jgi:hypothetical protein
VRGLALPGRVDLFEFATEADSIVRIVIEYNRPIQAALQGFCYRDSLRR